MSDAADDERGRHRRIRLGLRRGLVPREGARGLAQDEGHVCVQEGLPKTTEKTHVES